MKQRIFRLGRFVGLILVCGVSYACWQLTGPRPLPLTQPTDRIFASRVLDGQPVPAGVSKIQVAEGPIAFGYSNPPFFARFEATESFIKGLIEKDYGMYGRYSLMPCDDTPIKDGMIWTEWWRPSEVASPVCYSAPTCILYDEKYLLIGLDKNIGYFYRTSICGLCPGGPERVLRSQPDCRKYYGQ
jgi:hypothetical protein